MRLKIFTAVLLIAVLLSFSSCGANEQEQNPEDSPHIQSSEQNDAENSDTVENGNGIDVGEGFEDTGETFDLSEGIDFPESYTCGDYDKNVTATVRLSDEGIEILGDNVSADGTQITVFGEGTFLFTGKLSDGQITVNYSGGEKTSLVLNGVWIESSSAPIYVIEASDKVEIKIAEGSVNYLADGDSRESSEECNAVIYSKDDLEIEGGGVLYVNGNYEKGIHSKDDLDIKDVSLFVKAVDDGIRGKDSVSISSGNLAVHAGADGIRTNNTEDEGKGYIDISGGNIYVNAVQDAIQAVTDISVTGGNFELISGGGSINGSTDSEAWGNRGGGFGGFMGGGPHGMGDPHGGFYDVEEDEDSVSAKAVKAGNSVVISGGVFNVDSSDDAIHSNGNVDISGGTFIIKSGDDGIHSDNDLIISDGNITIDKSYEGIEGLDISISGGVISVVASDDGLNAAGGADGSSVNGRPGQNTFGGGFGGFGGGMAEEGNGSILISGGNITVNASGDGVDSNGRIQMDGGNVVVFGPTDGGNGTLDYTTEFILNGGTFVAIGSTGMAQDISAGSAQARVFVRVSGYAGDELCVTDSEGNRIFETVCPKQYGCILISVNEMEAGEIYSFYFNGELAGSVEASIK